MYLLFRSRVKTGNRETKCHPKLKGGVYLEAQPKVKKISSLKTE